MRQALRVLWALTAALCVGCRAGSEPEAQMTLAAVGDILLDRGVAQRIEANGPTYPFERVSDVLASADIAFGNLECPITTAGRAAKRIPFRAKPSTAHCLGLGGLDIVSLANNHALDCGRDGLLGTWTCLANEGIAWCGAGETMDAAERPTIVERNGLRVAFVAFSDFLFGSMFVDEAKPSLALASDETVRRCVSQARAQADIVVASLHWGVEYASAPSSRQRDLARKAVESGADLVIGHHPHVLQSIELLPHAAGSERLALIAYSLGNFVFDQRKPGRTDSVILRCRFTRSGLGQAEVLPVVLNEFRPEPATGDEAERVIARLAKVSPGISLALPVGNANAPLSWRIAARPSPGG